jgi:hypothetical protein
MHILLKAITATTTSNNVQADCMLIYYNLVEEGTAKLSDIYFLFYHMGFSTIYLIDPSCRAFSNPQSRYASLRPKTDVIVRSPPSYSSQEPLLFTQESDESIPLSHLSYKPYQPTDTQDSMNFSSQESSSSMPSPLPSVTHVHGWVQSLLQSFSGRKNTAKRLERRSTKHSLRVTRSMSKKRRANTV